MPNFCSCPCLILISCKNRAQRQNIFSVTMISDGCGMFKRRVGKYCEKYFIIIITNSTHLSTSSTFNVEDDWDISLQATSKTHLTPNYGVAPHGGIYNKPLQNAHILSMYAPLFHRLAPCP